MSGILASTFFAAVAPWLPTNLSTLVGWYDANDSSTITNVSGKASQWNDKSANANSVIQGTAGSRPTISAGINSLGTLTFATNNFLQGLSQTGLPSLATGIGFGLVQIATTLTNRAPWDISDTTNTNRTNLLLQNSSGNGYLYRANGTGHDATLSYSDTTNPHVLSGTATTTNRSPYLDGTIGTANTTSVASLTSVNLRIGELFQNVDPFIGTIGELVFFSGSSSTDRQQLEGYLAWKWGLQANLPNGHPYKNAPP